MDLVWKQGQDPPGEKRTQIVRTTRWQYNLTIFMGKRETSPLEETGGRDAIKQAFQVSGVS